uniref:Uncharacterized protein n=1 Tax=Cacopsylla melanoneura TaxID=428564 RepID=A0A8D8YMD1_9HEMI
MINMKTTDSLALILPGLNRLRPSDVITKVDIIAIIIIIGSSSESKFKLNLFRRLRFQGHRLVYKICRKQQRRRLYFYFFSFIIIIIIISSGSSTSSNSSSSSNELKG